MPNLNIENYHFEQFLAALNLGEIVSVIKTETPDYLITIGNDIIGIEFTQFFLSPDEGKKPQQELDRLIDLCIETARKSFRELGGPALYVKLHLAIDTPQTKFQARNLGERIAKALIKEEILDGGYTIGRIWDQVPEVDSYRMLHSVDGVDELWSAVRAGWVAPIPPEEIQKILDVKASKVEQYREKCNVIWLVIAHDIFRNGAPSELSTEAKLTHYIHEFDRLIWENVQKPSIIDLHKQSV